MDPMIELKAAFLEECEELLGALEERLNALRSGSTAPDDVNGAFRAIHSVKGGAGAFGLAALVDIAHVFEAALDHLRAGRLALDAAPYDLFLRAMDQVAALVAAARQGADMAAPVDMVRELQRVGHQDVREAAVKPAPALREAVSVPATPEVAGDRAVSIRIRPHRDLFRRAVDVRHVFAALEAFGVLDVKTLMDALPPLGAINPMDCHLAFDLALQSEADSHKIAELLELHFDADEFSVDDGHRSGTVVHVAREQVKPEAPQPAPGDGDGSEPASPAPPQAPQAAASVHKPNPAQTVREKQKAAGSIRVDLDRIDRLMNLVGEIVITQSMLDQRLLSLPVSETMQISDGLQVLGRQTRELQDLVMAVRAQPVKTVFQRMPRLVRELGQTLGKQARLSIIGEDTEVDKTIIEELADPLTHMIRNSMDHGLETPDERSAAGKAPEGVVTLQAEQRSGRIVISVSDDGRGINRDKLLAKARSRGLYTSADRPSPDEIDALLFHPGLSTADAVTDVSGRGVGMDVVKQNVESLGGRVLVSSEPGKGTRFTLLLPLTLAVMDGMIIRTNGQRLVLPIASIRETLQSSDTPVERLPGGQEFMRLRNRLSPLVRLGDVLGLGSSNTEQVIVMTETDRGNQIGLFVDEIIGQQQVVVKSLEATYGLVPGASAATILGDGLVALIVDVDAIPTINLSAAIPFSSPIPPTLQ
jgi:two-component system, chemotaxis family, sensor kinase CheA